MALLQVVLFLLLAPLGKALTSAMPRQPHTMAIRLGGRAVERRNFLAKGFGLAAAVGVSIAAPGRAEAKEKPLGLAPVALLYDELIDLKAQVRDGLKGSPVKRVVENTLEPMQRAMEKNPNNSQADITKALELKGHMFELAQAVRKFERHLLLCSYVSILAYPRKKIVDGRRGRLQRVREQAHQRHLPRRQGGARARGGGRNGG